MRADRLVAVLLLLQARGRLTVAEAAAELEVSGRTIRRDLEALSAAGIPVYSQPGRGGGWRLVGGARTDLSGLSAQEVRTLFAVAGPAAALTPELKSALRKLLRALPEPFRPVAEAAAAAVVVDPAGWGQPPPRSGPEHLDALQWAIAKGVQVLLGYRDRDGVTSARTVHPLGVVHKGRVWYLVAGTEAGLRTFRVGRVTAVQPTAEPVARPAGFDLARIWWDISERVDGLRTPAWVSAVAAPEVISALRWTFGTALRVGASRADGRVEVSVGGQVVELLARRLAGFGALVEVTGPPGHAPRWPAWAASSSTRTTRRRTGSGGRTGRDPAGGGRPTYAAEWGRYLRAGAPPR